jgi:hypothetical protein
MSELPFLVAAWEGAKPRLEELKATDPAIGFLYERMDRVWQVVRKGVKPKSL